MNTCPLSCRHSRFSCVLLVKYLFQQNIFGTNVREIRNTLLFPVHFFLQFYGAPINKIKARKRNKVIILCAAYQHVFLQERRQMCTDLYASALGIICLSVWCFRCILQESKLSVRSLPLTTSLTRQQDCSNYIRAMLCINNRLTAHVHNSDNFSLYSGSNTKTS